MNLYSHHRNRQVMKRFKGHEYRDRWTVLILIFVVSVHIKTVDSSPTLLIIIVGMLEACM